MIIGLGNQFSVFLKVAVLHRFYCTVNGRPSCIISEISEVDKELEEFVTYENNDVTKTSKHGDKTPVLKEEEEDLSK